MPNEVKPDPRIAAYIAEIEVPGVPYISRSHETLSKLYSEHGMELVRSLIDAYFKAQREAEGA